MNKLEKAAQTVITRALDLRKGESVLIIADEPYLDLAHLLFAAAEKKSNHIHLLQVGRDYLQRNALCGPVERLMLEMNVILALTSTSISHSSSRREACRQGARCITMTAITNDTFARIAEMDFSRIARLSRKLADILTIAKEIEISAPNGTQLRIAAARAKGYADTGEVTQPGAFSNLPAGEASLAPEFAGTSGEVVIDSGNGTGGAVAPKIFRDLGCEVMDLFSEVDGRFPNHHPDPTIPENMRTLIAKVRETGAELGIGFDGDADRIGAVDHLGNLIWGDQLLVIFSREILSRHPGATIVSEVKCSQNLYEDIVKHGGR
ncbi:MAG TPA: hypothetical protein PLG50_10780, partial [bacterium]|nr:hypothetical protein [bacterium]